MIIAGSVDTDLEGQVCDEHDEHEVEVDAVDVTLDPLGYEEHEEGGDQAAHGHG